jgi:cyanophycinase-like exopeptidase
MSSFFNKLNVRSKLQMIVATIAGLIANDLLGLGIDQATIVAIVTAVGTYVIGQGIADAGNGSSQ